DVVVRPVDEPAGSGISNQIERAGWVNTDTANVIRNRRTGTLQIPTDDRILQRDRTTQHVDAAAAFPDTRIIAVRSIDRDGYARKRAGATIAVIEDAAAIALSTVPADGTVGDRKSRLRRITNVDDRPALTCGC